MPVLSDEVQRVPHQPKRAKPQTPETLETWDLSTTAFGPDSWKEDMKTGLGSGSAFDKSLGHWLIYPAAKKRACR